MGKLTWLVVIVIVAVAAYFLLLSNEFSAGYDYVQVLKEQHGIGKGDIAPANMVQIRSLDAKLEKYEAELSGKPETTDVQALLLLVGMERNAIASQMKIIEARANIKNIGMYKPDCSAEGSAETAKVLLLESKGHINSAIDNAYALADNFPEQALTAGLDSGEDFALLMDAVSENVDELTGYVDARCP